MELDHVEPVVEVLTELAAGQRDLQVSIGGRNHAGVDLNQPVPPHPGEAQVLQDVQELGLERGRDLGDLIEVDRAVVRVLELPQPAPVGTGEGAPLVAEQLGFEEARRERRAVDLDERSLAAGRPGMDGPGDEVLPRSRFPAEQDRRIRIGDALDDRADGLHRRAFFEDRGPVDEGTLESYRSHGNPLVVGPVSVVPVSSRRSEGLRQRPAADARRDATRSPRAHGADDAGPPGDRRSPPRCRCHTRA